MGKWPLDVIQTKRKVPARELKLRGRPQKNPIKVDIETLIKPDIVDEEEVAILITKTTSKI